MKLFTSPNKKTIIISEKQAEDIRNILNETVKVELGNNPEARHNTVQKVYDKEMACPYCNRKAFFLMSICDEYNEADGENQKCIGTVDDNGKWKKTEMQSIGLYICPNCYKISTIHNMA